MKKIFYFLSLLMACVVVATSCEPENNIPEGQKPTIELTVGEATATSLTFEIAATNAEKVAYMVVAAAASFDADQIMASGVQVDPAETSVTVEDLESNKSYFIVAAASNQSGSAMATPISMKTLKDGEEPTPGDDPNTNPEPEPEPGVDPESPFEDGLEIVRTSKGAWYDKVNYYVTLEAATGEVMFIDMYCNPGLSDGKYIPEGRYNVVNQLTDYNTILSEYSGLKQNADEEYGFNFKSGYLDVSVVNGKYFLVFEFVLDDATSTPVRGSYYGPMSGASVRGDSELLTVKKLTSSSITFDINVEANQEWRCVVIEKVTYDLYGGKTTQFLANYGFPGVGPQQIVWANGEPHPNSDFAAQGMKVEVGPGTDYIILVALYDSASASYTSAVFEKVVHTLDPEQSQETVNVEIQSIEPNKVIYSLTPSANVFSYRTCVLKTELVTEAEEVYYTYNFSSFEAFMIYLIESSASESRIFYEPATVEWSGLWYDYDYTICTLVLDKSGAKGLSFVEFHTPRE